MTTQEAYEYMRIYLTRPGARQAIDSGDGCMYEAEIGGEIHRCAVGCLLSPETILEVKEWSATVEEILKLSNGARKDLLGVDRGFLLEAQCVHDSYMNWLSGFFHVESLDDVASKYGLSVVSDDVKSEQVPAPA